MIHTQDAALTSSDTSQSTADPAKSKRFINQGFGRCKGSWSKETLGPLSNRYWGNVRNQICDPVRNHFRESGLAENPKCSGIAATSPPPQANCRAGARILSALKSSPYECSEELSLWGQQAVLCGHCVLKNGDAH